MTDQENCVVDFQLLVEQQKELEELYDKHQLVPRLVEEFKENEELMAQVKESELPDKFILGAMVQIYLHQRADVPTMVGMLRHHFNGNCQVTADALMQAAEEDFLEYTDDGTMDKPYFFSLYDISEETKEDLERFQYPLPMVIPPVPVTNNLRRGYLTWKGSIILKDNHHDEDVCLDHINRMNSIPLTLNMDTALMVSNSWRDLDKPKVGETRKDYLRRVKAFEKYDRTALNTMEYLLQNTNVIYLTHAYDKRGRVYACGYHVNTQGTEWNKAVIELAEKELIED